MMRFDLYEDLKSPVKMAISVSVGQYAMRVEKIKWDRTFEEEQAIVGISTRKMMEAAGVADVESLREYMLEHFASESGFQDIRLFLVRNHIRHERTGNIHYE